MPQSQPTTSAFEILGPIMVGPSSSHTAGALRCAQVAASLMEGCIDRVRFTLYNSFAHTYRGHGTDRALVAGILGLEADDERIRDAFELARERGLSFEFSLGGDTEHLHPNTVDIELADARGARISVRGESLGGGRVRLSRINGVEVDITGEYDTVFVAHRDAKGVLAGLTVLLSEHGVNIAFMRTYRKARGGAAYTVFELEDLPRGEDLKGLLDKLRERDNVDVATLIRVPGAARATGNRPSPFSFSDASGLLEVCRAEGLSLGDAMRKREAQMSGDEEAERAMRRVMDVMEHATSDPVEHPQRSLGGLIGGEAALVASRAEALSPALMGTVQTEAVSRAMAVLERSASMGVIVAAPTAGSAGVVPGCLIAAAHALAGDGSTYHPLLEQGLWTASSVGLILSLNASVSGAEGGCQAEVGSAAAMAAAGLVEMMGGTPACALNAASITLSNLLGLVCDPVGGLVEVPCQTRNAIGVAAAISASQLALSGVASLVPFDEMARVMLEVGRSLPASLRETARGGVASAPSACAACGGCAAR